MDAVLGFKHLLQQADLDKAMSLCTGMRGKLKSRFLVLSDDRILPPPPTRPRGKRKQDSTDSGESNQMINKRTRGRSVGGVSGVTPIAHASNASLPISQPRAQSVNASLPISQPQTQPRPFVSQPGSLQAPNVYLGPSSSNLPSPFLRRGQFSIPPPVPEVNEGHPGSDQSGTVEDWASAHSDETIISCKYFYHLVHLMLCHSFFKNIEPFQGLLYQFCLGCNRPIYCHENSD